jgi:putative endonuclease
MSCKTPSKHKKFFFVYVLGSRRKNDRRTYVGWTTDVKRRLQQHNAGRGAKSTRGESWTLLYSECCTTRSEAMSREWHIKHDRKFRATHISAVERTGLSSLNEGQQIEFEIEENRGKSSAVNLRAR